ncbi:MAG: DUF192 domain-containing protein [Bdellovibrionota bacterium]
MKMLKNKSKNIALTSKLDVADHFYKKLVGMMGKSKFPENYCLWIKKTSSIHTHFMKVPIDVVFVNREMCVEKIYWNLKPWKITWPNFKYDSVFEFTRGTLDKQQLEIGDQLSVEA